MLSDENQLQTQNSLLSVRSAYLIAVTLLNSQSSSTWSDPSINTNWKSIWKAKLPPKVRLFAWKLASDALPTGSNLEKRIAINHPGFREILSDVLVFVVEQELIEYGTHFTNSTINSYRPAKWIPLEAGTIKINFDGAVLQKGCKVGIGGVARDSTGSVLAWFSRKYQRQVNGEIAEALAAKEAVDLAIRHGWNRILIEGDCLNLINKLNSSEPDYHTQILWSTILELLLPSAQKLAICAGPSLYNSHCFSPVEADLFYLLEADFQF
ncbi:hypothetical protein Sango_1558400 [Sesamum angolense]|uniref:RNase H type-1 domain-containing protein n=1 Tax=Sesamum angolense TaxID=2727404 RepID=A0AAE2BTP0_9LAMI|nr:hypothetical protein Sango_1558400 [Sesamum angolense]